MKYRSEIDGLRSIAVIPVILFHAGFEFFSGGFIGVDVFFVISGYLITTILIEDIENKRFSVLNFYERRARRILPALFFVMLCSIPFALLWMTPWELKDFSQSLVAVSLFASNILFWRKSGYFAEASEENTMIHTWSLAVEEQYYILFPLFLFLAWRYGKNRVFWIIVVLAAVSLALSEWGWRNKDSANFFLLPTRAWELFTGSITAFIIQKNGVKNNNILSFIGFSAIIFSIFVYDKNTPFPSVYALVPVIGVALIILFANRQTYIAKLLSTKLLVGVGLISYSLYLWHQPLFAFARIRSIDAPSQALMVLLIVASIILAIFSWKYIEQPFRRKSGLLKNRKQVFTTSIIGILIFIILGLAGHISKGFIQFYPKKIQLKIQLIDSAKRSVNPYREKCHLSENKIKHPREGCVDFLIDGKAQVVMLGDSHSDAISYNVQELLKKNNISSYAISYSGCIGFPGLYRVDNRNINYKCHEYNLSMLEYARNIGAKTLIITSRFPLYLNGNRYDNELGGLEEGGAAYVDLIKYKETPLPFDSDIRRKRVKDFYQKALKKLLQEFNVVLVYPIPEAGWYVPEYVIKQMRIGGNNNHTLLSSYNNRNNDVFEVFNNVDSNKLFRVLPAKTFCNKLENKCYLSDDKGVYYRDDDHLSAYGAKLLAPSILKEVSKSIVKK